MQAARNIILKHDDNCCSSSNFYDIKKFCCLWFPLFSNSTGCSGNFLSALVGRARQACLATANALFSGATWKHDGIIMTSDYSYSYPPIISAFSDLLKVIHASYPKRLSMTDFIVEYKFRGRGIEERHSNNN